MEISICHQNKLKTKILKISSKQTKPDGNARTRQPGNYSCY